VAGPTSLHARTPTFAAFTIKGKTQTKSQRANIEGANNIHRQHSREGKGVIGVNRHSNKHANGHIPKAQGAFKGLMTRGILQFALRIAFTCVLHSSGSQDIRC